LSLRETVIRLAETQAPTAGVRKYLERDEASWLAIMMSWPAAVPFDCHGTVVTAPVDPAWDALVAARDKLWQALGDGDLIGGLLSFSTGQLAPSKPERWRVREGFAAFQSERLDGGRVLLREVDFARWMAGYAPTVAAESDETKQALAVASQYRARGEDPEHRLEACPNAAAPTGAPSSLSADENVADDAAAKPQPTDRAVREWFKNRVDAWPDDRSAPSEDDDWLAITQHFAPGLTRDEFRIVRNDKDVTPPEWRTQGPRLLWGKVKARKSAEKPR
jgi:hypothetical protein